MWASVVDREVTVKTVRFVGRAETSTLKLLKYHMKLEMCTCIARVEVTEYPLVSSSIKSRTSTIVESFLSAIFICAIMRTNVWKLRELVGRMLTANNYTEQKIICTRVTRKQVIKTEWPAKLDYFSRSIRLNLYSEVCTADSRTTMARSKWTRRQLNYQSGRTLLWSILQYGNQLRGSLLKLWNITQSHAGDLI